MPELSHTETEARFAATPDGLVTESAAEHETLEEHERLCRCSPDPAYRDSCDHCMDDCNLWGQRG